jgi:hypothetical protein
MATTYTLISSVTVGSGGAGTIDFTSIPATYTDLKMVYSLRGSDATPGSYMQFNGTTTNYSFRFLEGNGSSTNSNTSAYGISTTAIYLNQIDGTGYTSNTFSNGEAYIPNYTSSNNKSISVDNVIENNSTTSYQSICAGLWSNSAAITSIKITPTSGNFVQYSTAYLYGISNA